MKTFQKQLNKLFIFLYFFLIPSNYSSYVVFCFFLVSFGFLICHLFCYKKPQVLRKDIIQFILLLTITLIGILFSPYPMTNTIQTLVFSIISFFAYKDDKLTNKNKLPYVFDWFYWGVLASTVLHLILFIKNNPGVHNFYISGGAWDVNVWSMVFFSFIVYCDSKRYKLWIPVAILVVLFCRESRGCLLVFMSFVLIKFVKFLFERTHRNNSRLEAFQKKTFSPLGVIISITLFTIVFSLFWTFVISSSDVAYYHKSINDGSNAVRFRSNIYVIEQIFKSPNFFFYGYDNSIRTVLGDFDTENNVIYLGYRLVQSHNSIINLFMKNGILFTIIYICILSILFRDSFSYKKMEHWIPYLIGSMLLHSMFSTGFLLFFVLALHNNEKGCFLEETCHGGKVAFNAFQK